MRSVCGGSSPSRRSDSLPPAHPGPIRCRVATVATLGCTPTEGRINSRLVGRGLRCPRVPAIAPQMPTSHRGTQRCQGRRSLEWVTARREVASAARMHAHQPTAAAGSPTPSAEPALSTRLRIMNWEERRAGKRGPCPLLGDLKRRQNLGDPDRQSRARVPRSKALSR